MNFYSKKLKTIVIGGLLFTCLTGFNFNYKIQNQNKAHEIAEIARSMGLPENDPIIKRAKEIWWENENQFQNDVDIIATVVYNEAWGGCSDRHRELVAQVIVNRVKSPKFPNTVYEVVTQPGQYVGDYTNENSWYRTQAKQDKAIWKECQRIARKALNEEIGAPDNILFQAEFVQGNGIYETHYTSYSTTCFCYG